jgi:hypothetical protein
MEVTPNGLVNVAVEMQQAELAQQVQVSVLKTTMDAQATAALALLQAIPGPLPLATTGSLGTTVNRMV